MTEPRMVVQCPVCQTVGPARALSVDSQGAKITCGACAAATRFSPYQAPISSPSLASAPPPAPAVSESQGQSGEARLRTETASPTPGPGADDPRMLLVYEVEGLPEALIDLYRQAVQQGDDEVAHAKVVRAAAASASLHLAGGLYRCRAEKLPGDAVAEAMRERVLKAAMTTVKPSDPEELKKQVRSMGTVVLVLFLLAALTILVLLIMRGGCPLNPLSP